MSLGIWALGSLKISFYGKSIFISALEAISLVNGDFNLSRMDAPVTVFHSTFVVNPAS